MEQPNQQPEILRVSKFSSRKNNTPSVIDPDLGPPPIVLRTRSVGAFSPRAARRPPLTDEDIENNRFGADQPRFIAVSRFGASRNTDAVTQTLPSPPTMARSTTQPETPKKTSPFKAKPKKKLM
ncbi:UNVERIFIED_CONTAM: hypothetical protein HDU68_005322, partial [Siphonaria sp. JEL0065]